MMVEVRKLTVNDTGKEFYDMLQTIEEEHAYMHDANGIPYALFPAWLAFCTRIAEGDVNPFSTYWFLADGKPVGIGRFHHELTEELRQNGGHLVYCIAPEYRGKGYGAAAVAGLVQIMRESGIPEIQFMIKKTNIPSLRCAEKCGAVRTSENETYYFLTVKQQINK